MCVARQFAGPYRGAGAVRKRQRVSQKQASKKHFPTTTTPTDDACSPTATATTTLGSRRVTLDSAPPSSTSGRLVAGVMPLSWYASAANTRTLPAPPGARDRQISAKQELCPDTPSDKNSPPHLRSRNSRMKGGESPEPLPDGEPDVQHFRHGQVTYDSRVAHELSLL